MLTKQGSVLVTGGSEVTTSVDGAPVMPFAGVTVADPTPGATDTVSIEISAAQGRLADGPGHSGLTVSIGSATESPAYVSLQYDLPAGTPSEVTAELDDLVFTPSATASYPETGVLLSAISSQPENGLVTDRDDPYTQTETSVDVVPTRSVSLDPAVTYGNGAFALTGTAQSIYGVTGVEISAVLNDGTRQDLGAATVNADGTFTFSDVIGANRQSFLEATLTDGAGGQVVSADPGFSLKGGLGPGGGAGQQTRFIDAGAAIGSIVRFGPDGRRIATIAAPDQTVDLRPFDIVFNGRQADTSFVFSQGNGLDVIRGFKLRGADHDTIALPSSDFASLADVFRNTGDIQGSAFITDPKTGDAIRLAGVTTAELKAHPRDITLV